MNTQRLSGLCAFHGALVLRGMIAAVILALLLPLAVSADMGPKPSVRIALDGLGGEVCYGTLLSARESTGPETAWNGKEETARYREGNAEYEIWKAFVGYEDADGYYFLQWLQRCDESKSLDWTYYPPSPFKILLYFPESDTFAVSGIYERYAFDSYFTADASRASAGGVLAAVQSYDHTWETISLLARIVLTILLELAVALLFGYQTKKPILLIALTNVFTQTLLNVLLNIINYNQGPLMFTARYVLLELVVFAVEAVLYAALLPRLAGGPTHSEKTRKRSRAVVYALTANAASFATGLLIAHLVPGIF